LKWLLNKLTYYTSLLSLCRLLEWMPRLRQ
jgi:hypothetical protein